MGKKHIFCMSISIPSGVQPEDRTDTPPIPSSRPERLPPRPPSPENPDQDPPGDPLDLLGGQHSGVRGDADADAWVWSS